MVKLSVGLGILLKTTLLSSILLYFVGFVLGMEEKAPGILGK